MPGKLTAFLRFAPVAVLAFLVGCVVDGPPPPGPGAGFCTREYAPVCGARLSYFSTTTIFGTPVDITLSEIAVEAFFPADAATAAALRGS